MEERSLRLQQEDADAARKEITELKTLNALYFETILVLEPDVCILLAKQYQCRCSGKDNTAIQFSQESMEPELFDDNSRMQELFQHDLLLELDTDLKNAEAKFLKEELRPPKLSHGGTFTDLAISPVLMPTSEDDLAN